MKNLQRLHEIRHELHKNIVQHTVKNAGAAENVHILLHTPIDAAYIKRDHKDRMIQVPMQILGLDGTLGELLAITVDNEEKKLYYNDLTLEELAKLYDILEAKKYTVKELIPC